MADETPASGCRFDNTKETSMNLDSIKPRVTRRLALLGVGALLGATGVGTYLVVSASSAGATHLTRSATHLTRTAGHLAAAVPAKVAPKAATAATDPDNIQQGSQSGQDQSGPQDNSGGPDTSTGPEAGSGGAESDGPGGHTDPAGSAGQQGDFNN
jgi:hypothetical protein